ESSDFHFSEVNHLGSVTFDKEQLLADKHIQAILEHPLVDVEAIRAKDFKVVVDAINSTGALFVPRLLEALGVSGTVVINEDVNGQFAHNPEPLPEHLQELSSAVVRNNADLGIAV